MAMNVSQVMKKEIVKVKRATPLRVLLHTFKDFHSLPLIPVVDNNNLLLAVVYPENLLDILRPQPSRLFRNIPFVEIDEDVFDLDPASSMGELIIVEDIMDTNVVSVKEDDTLEDVYKTMRLHKKDRLPVVDAMGSLVGIVGIFDVILRMFQEKGVV
jgi:CBS domain-containing protein